MKAIVEQPFSDVKKRLDASRSYLIFENDLKRSGDSILSEDHRIYRQLAKHRLDWERIKDADGEYVIVQTTPGKEDQMLGRIMAGGIPKEIICYVYKANPLTG